MPSSHFSVAVAALLLCRAAFAQTSTSLDAKVQAPQLGSPQRASLAGQLSSVAFGPADVARGAFSLPLPLSAPQERGPLLASIFPSYSADAGISEFGLGWTADLAVKRFRVAGDLDYATDELSSPFGRLVKGGDGLWYPAGLSKAVRVAWSGDVITATEPDGTVSTYGGTARFSTVRGTFAWHLTEVRTATNRKTKVDWISNASGRLFVSSVSYGGVGDDFQYRIDFAYETLARSFEDYRSGQLSTIDRRVRTATVLAKNAVSGAFEERWHYDLGYQAEGFGPGFYLVSVQQTFRSGEQPPAATYGYDLARDRLAVAPLAVAPKVAAVLQAFGYDALQPSRSTLFEVEQDGLADLEHSYEYRTIHQTDSGFTFEALPPAPPDVYSGCRKTPSAYNVPRLLAELRAGVGDETQYVVDLRSDSYGLQTWFNVCNRVGQRLGGQVLTGLWAPSSTIRLVDVNRDHQPDLVRVLNGSYRVLPNASTASTFSFGASRGGALSPAFTPDTAWVHDFNGDGMPDLLARYPTGVVVWFGKGNFEFASPGRSFGFASASGVTITNLTDFGMTWVDANRDGLADVILTRTSGNTTYLFMNNGGSFVETVVPGLRAVDAYSSKPVIADFTGSGNMEVSYTRQGQGYAVALDAPSTGLMISADDGRGTVLRFEYARAPATAGARQRQSVVSRIVSESSGYDVASYDYDYASPKVHSAGKFLLGFDRVTRVDPILTHTIDFLNEDRYSGVFLASRQHDSNAPSVDAFESKTYEEALFQGIPWKRLRQEASGFVDAAGATVSDQTDYLTYVRDFCAQTATRTTASGVLTITKTFVQPSAFGSALSCVVSNAVEQGSHADSALDFRHETALTVNSVGLVDMVESVATAGRWTLQTIGYRPDWLVDSISSPGKGSTAFSYEPGTLLLRSVTSPDGVVVEALSRDPLHDGILTLKTTRGTALHQQFSRFDGQERLSRTWDDLGSATELNPSARYDYQFATASEPAAVYSSRLVDTALASARDGVDLLTASGEPVVTASRIPEGWAFGGLVTRSRTTAESKTHLRPTAASTVDPMALDHAALLSGADEIASEVSSTFGHASLARTTYHAAVERQLAKDLTLSGGYLRLRSTENGTHTTDTWMDAGKRVHAFDDEAAVRYAYRYDALGRLREVTLPDGNKHRAKYDAHGRVWRVEREGLPGAARVSIENVFDATTGLPTTKKHLTAPSLASSDTLVRSVGFTYDAIGRVSIETHTIAATAATKTFRYYYDGATPAQPALRTTLGLLTGVSGDGFTKTLDYRADGLLARRVVTLSGWRSVETALAYLESGVVGSRTVKVLDAAGAQLSSSAQTYVHDTYGRVQTVKLNGSTFATFTYGTNGEIRTATFPGSNDVTIDYDALTRRFTGSTQHTPQYTAGTAQLMNARGLVDAETLTAGATSVSRAFGYSAQRFLTSSADALATYGYGFDGFGLPSSITTNGVTKTIVQSGNTLTAGSVVYTFDSLGRTAARGDLAFAYGPDGQIASATRGASSWSFVHDEGGQRLLKRAGATAVAAYVDEGYLDATGLTERVQVAGRTVGLLKNGVFTTTATDARGTVLAETNGTARFASPFGARDVRPSMSAAIDYVEKGYDADLGLVRMGVRDYDPAINRFTTADPLFLESVEACLDGTQCNLFAYARANPEGFIDPDGRYGVELLGAVHETMTKQAAKDTNTTYSSSLDQGVAWPDVPGDGSKTNYPRTAREMSKPGTLAYRSHHGDLQHWHAMATSAEKTNGQVADKMLGDFRQLWFESVEGGSDFAFGRLLHTVQDSFAPSHVARDQKGLVLFFQNYEAQDMGRHREGEQAAGKDQAIPGVKQATEATKQLMIFRRDRTDFSEVERYLRNSVFPFAPGSAGATPSGSLDRYRK